MGININVPNRINQNTPLHTVRSGATADTDNNVKYVPQTLTEAQQAQARENIGAGVPQVQADWNQNDITAPDYIKNKPEITPGGGATVNEFHYKRGGSEGEYYYYIDCPGYTPAEGDLMIVIFDWIMDPTAGCTLRNGTDVINIDLRNAPSSEYNYYDDIYGTPNTRWTVKLEKDSSDNWHAYNISTIEFPDWNVTDEHAVGYIKNKPSLPMDEIPEDFRNSITVWSNVDTTLTSKGDLISVYNRGVKTTLAAGTKTCDIKSGKNVVVGSFSETQFANKNGIYWVWTPRSFANSHTVFGSTYGSNTHKHLNIIYYGGGYWNSQFGSTEAGSDSKIFALNNAATGLWQGFNTNNNADIVFPDDAINLTGAGTGSAPRGNGKWYVPQVRYEEFITKCAAKWTTADPSTYLSKIIVYDHLEQRGFELNIVPIEKKNYFYVENTTNADETVTIQQINTLSSNMASFEVKISNDATTWTTLGTTSTTALTFTLAPGAKKYIKAYTYAWGPAVDSVDPYLENFGDGNKIFGMNKIGGNIMSLLYGDEFENNNKVPTYAFRGMFINDNTLTDASDLVIGGTIFSTEACRRMFYNCQNLVSGPEKIVIDGLVGRGSQFEGMFDRCGSLINAAAIYGDEITDNNVAAGAFTYMFHYSGIQTAACYTLAGMDNAAIFEMVYHSVAANGTLYIRKGTLSTWQTGNALPLDDEWQSLNWTIVEV